MRRDASEFATPGSPEASPGAMRVRTILPEALDDRLIDAWRRLGERALEPNAYLTPMFVLPALAHLGASLPLEILLIETSSGQLVGVGIFKRRSLLPLLPLEFLEGFRSKHSYLTGLLIDRACAGPAVDAFFAFVSAPGSRWHGVRFDWLNSGNALGALLLERARRQNIWWSESERMRRAVLRPQRDNAEVLLGRIPAPRLRDLRRCLRRLDEKGEVDWRIVCGKALTDDVIDCFLSLEHMGWKGEAGTSVRANPAHERFFKAMIAGFRECAGVFFTELRVDGRVIASTCNLVSGARAFAFKIGWNPEYARFSPGMLNELCLLERAGQTVGHLELIDSGAVEGSFIDRLWFDRQDLVSGVFATTRIGKLCFAVAAARRRLRCRAAGWRRLPAAVPGHSAPTAERPALPRCS